MLWPFWTDIIGDVVLQQQLHLGRTETLQLDVSAYPDLTYKWTKDGQAVTFPAGGPRKLDRHTGSITFNPVQKSDEGNYRCDVTSNVFTDHTFSNIIATVIGKAPYDLRIQPVRRIENCCKLIWWHPQDNGRIVFKSSSLAVITELFFINIINEFACIEQFRHRWV